MKWLHDDWFLYFLHDGHVISFCCELEPEWLAHDCGMENCGRCETIWLRLKEKHRGLAFFGFAQNAGMPYIAQDWCDPLWLDC